MSELYTIPVITDPLGKHWNQPSRDEILVDDFHALMPENVFKKLAEYSCTYPTGVYEGKMWKAKDRYNGNWFLEWYDKSENPGKCSIQCRLIIIL